MGTRANVLLLFSKLPETGLVKTRLTAARGGLFTDEDAARLYEAMLLDVVAVCLGAFGKLEDSTAEDAQSAQTFEARSADVRDSYELVVSTAPAKNAPAMHALLERAFPEACADGARFPIRVIADAGATFDEHYNDAFDQCWQAGADCILSMGADMPALTVDDVVRGFQALHAIDEGALPGAGANEEQGTHAAECNNMGQGPDGRGTDGGIVLAPDQEMGVSIIGWTRNTDFDHTGVFYNPTGLTVLPAYVEKAQAAGLPALWLPPVPDVDTMADLMHNVTLANALDYCTRFDGGVAPERTLEVLRELGCDEVRVPPNDLMDPRSAIDEPA